jgi:predicted metal-dependent enzyme (double-stranded beta helix superfamily)
VAVRDRSESVGWARPGLDWVDRAGVGGGEIDLREEEICAFLGVLASRTELARRADALRPERGERSWECLLRDAHLDVYVIAWTGGADTGWHDHDLSVGAVRVLQGAVTEHRLSRSGEHPGRELRVGQGLSFGADHVHRMTVAEDRAVTLHGYSPPLHRMGQYSFDAAGALQRRTITYEEALRAGLEP